MKLKIAVPLVVSLLGVACPAYAAEKLKIAFMVSMTGVFSGLGAEQERGFNLALEHLGNRIGGLPVEVTRHDDQSKPDLALQLAKGAMTLEKVQIITGIVPSNVLVAIAKTVSDSGVFLISGMAGASTLAGKDCLPNLFVVSWENEVPAMAIGQYVSNNVKRPYFIGANYQGGWGWVNGAKRFYKGTIAGERFTPLNTFDFSSDLAQMRAARPDSVLAMMAGNMIVPFMKQYHDSGLKRTAPLYGSMFMADDLTFPGQGDTALGLMLSAHWYPNMDNAANKKFVEAFRAKYNRNPAMYAQQQYDAVMLIDSAVRAVGGQVEDTDRFRAALKKADFISTRGKFQFGNNHFPIQDFYIVKVVKNAKGEYEHELVAKAMENAQDVYHDECPMK